MNSRNDARKTGAKLPRGGNLEIPWHLRFSSSLEARFCSRWRDESRHIVIPSTILMLLLYISAFALEAHLAPEVIEQSWRPRLFAMMTLAGVLVVALHPR